jgi:3-oxoacyl-[acyl-carrier protein] reductase
MKLTLAQVFITYTSESSEKLVHDLVQKTQSLPNSPRVWPIRSDLSKVESASEILDQVEACLGSSYQINILVNNAGITLNRPLGEITPSDFESVYNINVRVSYRSIYLFQFFSS